MAKETEVKVKIGSKETAAAKLDAAGFSKADEYHERNLLMDKGEEMKKSDRLLRFRKIKGEGGKELFTYKGPREGGMKTREEIEFPVDIVKLSKVFERLGYSISFKYEKKRQVWEGRGPEVVVDELPYLGSYMEIEGDRDLIEDLLEELGIPLEETITDTYFELFESYREENEVDAEFLVWEDFGFEDV